MDPMDIEPGPLSVPTWHVVVPVKGRSGAKTRLVPPPGVDRGELALAMACDALVALRRVVPVDRVVVVTSDADLAASVRAAGAHVVADPGTGLVTAVEAGLAVLPLHVDRAVLLGDLPALRSDELAAALSAGGGQERSFVADRGDTGTTLLLARAGTPHDVHFGTGSAAAHAAAGYRPLALEVPSLRTDVDDADDLRAAVSLGCGPATTALLPDAVCSP